MIRELGEDLEVKNPDPSELHVCNVVSSDDYMGDKIFEGFLKKEGIFKTLNSRFFVLRSRGLYWYNCSTDKNHKEKDLIQINHDSFFESNFDSKNGYYFIIYSKEKILKLFGDSEDMINKWIYFINEVIQAQKIIFEGKCLLDKA